MWDVMSFWMVSEIEEDVLGLIWGLKSLWLSSLKEQRWRSAVLLCGFVGGWEAV